MKCFDYVILGAGVAGLTAAAELRERDLNASIALLDQENVLPYKRTKLSKNIAKGYSQNDYALYPLTWYKDHRIDLLLGIKVTEISPGDRWLVLDNGDNLGYGKLLIAQGAQARQPATGVGIGTVLPLRSMTQAQEILRVLESVDAVTVLGNGILGVEISEQLILKGKRVTLFSKHPMPLHRDLTEVASGILKDLLEYQGISQVKVLTETPKWAVGAVGSEPDLELVKHAGIKVNEGILVNDQLQTSAPNIWAAGDCTEDLQGRICHLWHQAEAQGLAAAQFMTNRQEAFIPQVYRMKLEVFGQYFFSMNKPDSGWWDRDEIRRGSRYYCFYFSHDRLEGVVMVGDKARSKLFEQAVHEHWNRERVHREFGPF